MSQIQSFEDPRWPRASEWLAGKTAEKTLGWLAVLGAHMRLGSITPGRCDLAPPALRSILRKYSCYDVEADTDLHLLGARDLGDLPLADLTLEDALEPISSAVDHAIENAEAVVLI